MPCPEGAASGRTSSAHDGSGPRVALVVIGHVGYATDRTARGTSSSVGGSGYAVAAAASVIFPGRVGLVAQIGADFDQAILRRLNLDLDGVAVLPGASAKFRIDEYRNGRRSFQSALGVATCPRPELFPASYLHASWVHLGTMPPQQQLIWLNSLRRKATNATISVDMFEHFVTREAAASREACDQADLVFLNRIEHEGLYGAGSYPKATLVLKNGPGGADLVRDGVKQHHAHAPWVRAVDTVGAGEILAGVFLGSRAQDVQEATALRYAVAAATRSVTEFGVDGPRITRALSRTRLKIHGKLAQSAR
jgi:sugar/nucleoside kinase (ribokinase family)